MIRTKTNKKIEDLRKELEALSIGKQLFDPDVVRLSNKLDTEIIKYMSQSKNN